MFEKKGRVQFRAGQTGSSVEDMMDSAIDAGAEDMQELEDESIEVRKRRGKDDLNHCDFCSLTSYYYCLGDL
jgi:transcriptional/translational regulatory protein YebC/TACO1